MEEKKSRYWRVTAIFFGVMVAFTLLSRAVYQRGVAVVTTERPSGGAIAHTVTLTGKTTQNQEVAVTTVAGLRVAAVHVDAGQQVAAGEPLFTLDLDYLEETILRQKQDMEKQRLSVQDAWSQQGAAQRQKANQQAQAEENYYAAVSQGETALDRAARELERAEAALDSYYNGVSAAETEEAALLADLEAAKAREAQANSALTALEAEIETAVQAAVQEAQAQPAPVEPETQPAPETPENPEDAENPGDSGTQEPPPADPAPIPEPIDPEAIAQAVRAEYAQALADAQYAAQQAQAERTAAEAALAAFRADPGPALSEEDLIAAVENAQQRYEDAYTSLENAQTTYGRAIATAELPSATSHSAQIGQITYDQMALALEKLEALREAGGVITAPVEGVVTACALRTGEKTTDSTALLLADLSKGCRFSGLVSEEQVQYIGVGDKVVLRAEGSGKECRDLTVTTLAATAEAGGYALTVQMPAGAMPLGAAARLSFTRKTQPYGQCVPLSALHLDSQGRTYVLVAELVDTVLGAQLQARKVTVTVLDRNESTAALEEGALGAQQEVIVGSDRAVDSGSRIRVE